MVCLGTQLHVQIQKLEPYILGLRQTERGSSCPAFCVLWLSNHTVSHPNSNRGDGVLSRRGILHCQSSSCSPRDTICLPVC